MRKKGKKAESDNTVDEQEATDAVISNGCKGIFTNVNAKMICCNRGQKWFCTKCMNITNALHIFLASKETEDIAWFCKACKEPAKKAIIEDKCIEGRCKEYTKTINKKLRSIEVGLQNITDAIEIDRLQKRIENIEKGIWAVLSTLLDTKSNELQYVQKIYNR